MEIRSHTLFETGLVGGLAIVLLGLGGQTAFAQLTEDLDASLERYRTRMRGEPAPADRGAPPMAAAPERSAHGPQPFDAAPFSLAGNAMFASDREPGAPLLLSSFDEQPGDEGSKSELSLEGGDTDAEEEVFKDDSGNDPRDFRNKFMPYYRYTELRNGVEVHELTLFGFWAWTPRIGMTYELPAFKYVDVSEAVPSIGLPGPGGTPGPPIPGFGGRAGGPNIDAYDFGMGDLILRFFLRPEFSDFTFDAPNWGPRKGTKMGGTWFMPILETTVPTHTDDLLGTDEWILSPGFAFVIDTPTMGFFAMMNFYDFNVLKDGDVPHTSRFRGRWFLLQPFSKPGPGWLDGWYMMPEFQPVYDLREQRFSLWIGPEFGKIFKNEASTVTFYAKPGWGWNKDSFQGDREFTFEFGVRLFF